MSAVTLPSGATIEIRTLESVRERERRQVRLLVQRLSPAARAVLTDDDTPADKMFEMFTEADAAAMYELNDMLAVLCLSAWSFAVPISVDAFLDLQGDDYDAVLRAAAPAIKTFFVATDFAPNPGQPDSPTSPSNVVV